MKRAIFRILLTGFIIAAVFVGCFVFYNYERSLNPREPIAGSGPEPELGPAGNESLEVILLDKEGPILPDQCSERGISGKVIVLETKYCGACKTAVPRLREVEKELNAEFIYLDLSEQKDMEKLNEFKVWPKYTPTVIIGCDVLIGGYPKDEYKNRIKNFLDNQKNG